MELVLFVLIGQQLNMGTGYWVFLTVYTLFKLAKIVGEFIEEKKG